MHELIHCMPYCNNHGKEFKKYANIINEMMEKTDKNMPFGIIKPNDVYELVKYLTKEGNKITGQTILMDSGVVLDVNKKK